MRKKIYLARHDNGNYGLYKIKPTLYNKNYYSTIEEKDTIIVSLCEILVKQWFGLKHHLRRNTCICGTFSVSFTPDKLKKGKS